MDEAIRNLKNNAHWITIKIKEGYKIFDIGPEITGQSNGSIWYKVEKAILEYCNYPVSKIKPKTIKGNVIEFGIIKCLRSIKYIMINDKLKIINNNVVSVKP